LSDKQSVRVPLWLLIALFFLLGLNVGRRVEFAIFSPCDIGFPITRPRQFALCTLKNECVLEASWKDFYGLFLRELKAPASLLVNCPPEYTHKVMLRLRAQRLRRGNAQAQHVEELVELGPYGRPDILMCLTEGEKRNYLAYLEVKD
jgi:hypothetical protein